MMFYYFFFPHSSSFPFRSFFSVAKLVFCIRDLLYCTWCGGLMMWPPHSVSGLSGGIHTMQNSYDDNSLSRNVCSLTMYLLRRRKSTRRKREMRLVCCRRCRRRRAEFVFIFFGNGLLFLAIIDRMKMECTHVLHTSYDGRE